jgi:prefoldin subunit 5
MPANGNASTTTTKTTKTTKRSDGAQIREGITKARNGTVAYVRQTAERAVDVPVGAALLARERVNDAVEPWTSTETRDKELSGLRTQVTRELNKFERRGGQARRRASQRARRTRTRVEREVRQRRRAAERTVKQRRTRVERQVRHSRSRVEDGLKKAQDSVAERVSTRS